MPTTIGKASTIHGLVPTLSVSTSFITRFARTVGAPEFTFCDVERAIQRELGRSNLLAGFELRTAQTLHSAEMETLVRLEAKYRAPASADRQPDQSSATPVACDAEPPSVSTLPVQTSSF